MSGDTLAPWLHHPEAGPDPDHYHAKGATDAGKKEGENLFIVPDRREALARAVQLAGPEDIVVATGKGAEQWICVADGKKIPWDERIEMRKAIEARKAQ